MAVAGVPLVCLSSQHGLPMCSGLHPLLLSNSGLWADCERGRSHSLQEKQKFGKLSKTRKSFNPPSKIY